MRLHELIIANEKAITGMSEDDINKGLDHIIDIMERAIELGITTTGVLPGPIGLQRKASVMYERAKKEYFQGPGFLKAINAYALAASKKTHPPLCGHSPTCGAAGVIPAICSCSTHMGALQEEIRQGLLAAVAIGFYVNTMRQFPVPKLGVRAK